VLKLLLPILWLLLLVWGFDSSFISVALLLLFQLVCL
jgi:hypothetical protein